MQETIWQVQMELNELRANFNVLSDVHSVNISAVRVQLADLQLRVDDLTPDPPPTTDTTTDVTTPPGVAMPTPRPYVSIPLL